MDTIILWVNANICALMFFTIMEYSMKIVGNGVLGLSLFISSFSYAGIEDNNYRHSRYCEVIVGKGLQASVYTTFQLNNCPQSLWNSLNVKKIKYQNKATFIYLNGPRYFIIDKYKFQKTVPIGDVKYFGGIKMHKVADVKIGLKDIVKGFRPFVEHSVYRQTTWIYKAGKPVYEIISPDNKVYVMQSYSDEVIKQNDASLAKLGRTLILPRGWRYKTGILKKDESLITQNNIAIVTQDNFKNTYQLADRDFL